MRIGTTRPRNDHSPHLQSFRTWAVRCSRRGRFRYLGVLSSDVKLLPFSRRTVAPAAWLVGELELQLREPGERSQNLDLEKKLNFSTIFHKTGRKP